MGVGWSVINKNWAKTKIVVIHTCQGPEDQPASRFANLRKGSPNYLTSQEPHESSKFLLVGINLFGVVQMAVVSEFSYKSEKPP